MKNNSLLMIGNYLLSTRWNKNISYYLAENLVNAGWNVITTSSKENRILRLFDMLCTVWKERRNYSLGQIDVFSGNAFFYAEVCVYFLGFLKKPIILTLHGGGLPEFSLRYPKRVNKILNSVNAVVTPSLFIKNALSRFRSDIKLIPNPIELSSSIFRTREKVSSKIIWVRAFHNVYNPTMIPAVIKQLSYDYPNVHLIMLGPDKGDGSLQEMKSISKELGVEQRIEIVGGVDHVQIPIWLDKADIFINSTNYDTAPRSLLEAMANGLCIVSTNVGGIPYMITDGIDGLLVPPNDPISMANACIKILNCPSLASQLSINARKKVENLDWKEILPQWESLLTKIQDEADLLVEKNLS